MVVILFMKLFAILRSEGAVRSLGLNACEGERMVTVNCALGSTGLVPCQKAQNEQESLH